MSTIDYQSYIEDFLATIDNLPGEIAHLIERITDTDRQLHHETKEAHSLDISIRKSLKSTPLTDQEKEIPITTETTVESLLTPHQLDQYNAVSAKINASMPLVDKKIEYSKKLFAIFDRHVNRMTADLEKITDVDGIAITQSNHDIPPTPTFGMKRQRNPSKKRRTQQPESDGVEAELYCVCREVSYGNMIGCDGETCATEWFHMACVGLSSSPTGLWYCSDCIKKQ